jgi:hypothetical protein
MSDERPEIARLIENIVEAARNESWLTLRPEDSKVLESALRASPVRSDAVGDLLAYGEEESTNALTRKDRDQYQFWQGWCAALSRVKVGSDEAVPSDTPKFCCALCGAEYERTGQCVNTVMRDGKRDACGGDVLSETTRGTPAVPAFRKLIDEAERFVLSTTPPSQYGAVRGGVAAMSVKLNRLLDTVEGSSSTPVGEKE